MKLEKNWTVRIEKSSRNCLVQCRTFFQENKKWLCFALMATFVWGLAAHGYGFFHGYFTHDSLAEFHAEVFGNTHKMHLGRVLTPAYRAVFRSALTLPWLIGLLSLLWTGLAVFLTLRMFDVKSKSVAALIAGVFVSNITFSAIVATYINDLDCNMFSLLCAVAAAFCWSKWGKQRGIFLFAGSVLTAVSMGIYQSFIFTTVTLIILACLMDLLHGKTASSVFRRGVGAIGMILLGGVCYFVGMKVMLRLAHLSAYQRGDNSVYGIFELTLEGLPVLISNGYQDCFRRLFYAVSAYGPAVVTAVTVMILVLTLAAFAVWLFSRSAGWREKVLFCLLLAVLPLGMNMIYVLAQGVIHDLMVYAIWLTYLLALLAGEWLLERFQTAGQWRKSAWCCRTVCLLLVAVLLYGNLQYANGMYLKKDLETDAYLSKMTRVVDRIEDQAGYIPGQTPVVFVGVTENYVIPGFEAYYLPIGMTYSGSVRLPNTVYFGAYVDYILQADIRLADDETWEDMQMCPEAMQLQPYPAKNCIAVVDGVMLLKLGEQ